MSGFDFSHEIEKCSNIDVDWDKIDNKTLMITGATGLVGKYLIEVLMKRNIIKGTRTKVIAVGRNEEGFLNRFKDVEGMENTVFYQHDVMNPCEYKGHLDYIIHMASNTHPRLYAVDPIGTEMINILGSYYLLSLAEKNPGCRFVFASSGDVYGDNRSEKAYIEETDCGYIDCNTLRAGYIEGKRASEALCNAFKESKGIDFVIPRLCRIYGPTMNTSDSKAISQFINKAVNKENIELKSEGKQIFSYLYIYDVISALLYIITKGKSGEAYNVADNEQVISLRDLAIMLSEIGESKVEFNKPDDIEAKGASSFQDVRLDATKLYNLGWKSQVNIRDGLQNTVNELRKK